MGLPAIIDALRTIFPEWAATATPYVTIALVFSYFGFLISRMCHQGIIDTQKAHLAMKDESIRMKDTAIASNSAITRRTEPETPVASTPVTQPPQQMGDPRFNEINARITAEIEAKIRACVLTGPFRFVFNPESGASKTLTFKPNGEVDQGRNDNEYNWRISAGRLEFVKPDSRVYSRFFLLPDGRSFHHTNDPDTLSIRGQYLIPIAIPEPNSPGRVGVRDRTTGQFKR